MAVETIVHEDDGQWFFWDESWADRYGPYETREEAAEMHNLYCRDVLNISDIDVDMKVIEAYTLHPQHHEA